MACDAHRWRGHSAQKGALNAGEIHGSPQVRVERPAPVVPQQTVRSLPCPIVHSSQRPWLPYGSRVPLAHGRDVARLHHPVTGSLEGRSHGSAYVHTHPILRTMGILATARPGRSLALRSGASQRGSLPHMCPTGNVQHTQGSLSPPSPDAPSSARCWARAAPPAPRPNVPVSNRGTSP